MRKPKVIHVSGRRWFGKTNGNTYHTCRIWVDGKLVYVSGLTYGYRDQYEATAERWLYENGYLKGIESYSNGGRESLYYYCEKKGIKLVSDVSDVCRRKDL